MSVDAWWDISREHFTDPESLAEFIIESLNRVGLATAFRWA
jgi:hypothetical protein